MARLLGILFILGRLAAAAQDSAPPVPSSQPSAEFAGVYQKAQASFMQGNYDASLKLVESAIKAGPDQAIAYNLKGAILAKKQDYAGSKAMFEKTGSLIPNAWEPKFNIFELLFLQKKYSDARAGYQELLKTHPKEGSLIFRVFMSYLMEGNSTEAKKILDAMDPYGSDASYYMAQSVWFYKQGNTAEGNSWVASAQKIYSPVQLFYYFDCLMDEGWVKRDSVEITK
jgi:tetratricopeptide (TPR) repeat protein